MRTIPSSTSRPTSARRLASRRLGTVIRHSSQQDLETNQPRAPNAPPSSGFAPPPPPPPRPPQPQPTQGAAPTRRELLFFAGGSVLGAVAHTAYLSQTTIELTDPEALERLFTEAILEEQVLQAKGSVVQLEAALQEIDEQLGADEAAIRADKATDGRPLDDVRAEAELLRTRRLQILGLTDDMKQTVVEMTQALKNMKQ